MNLEKVLYGRINNVMSWQETKWFFCFGTLLNIVRYICAKRTINLKLFEQDIDLGMIYDQCDYEQIIKAFTGNGYRITHQIINDVTGKPLNIHFTPDDETPTIDVYFWIKKGDFYYHTYDFSKEGKKIPSKYVFKGIKSEWIDVSRITIKNIQDSTPDGRFMINNHGVWTLDAFEDHGDMKFYIPYNYSALLFEWYGCWILEDKRFGQSKTRWLKKIKSCGEL